MSTDKRGGKRAGRKPRSAKKKSSLPSFGFDDDLLKGSPAEKEAPAETPPAETPPPSPGSAGARPRVTSLPAYGFADELLKELKGTKSPPPAAPPDAEPAAADSASSPADSRAPGAGEERIFEFAASLEADLDENEVAPVRLESWVTFQLAGEIFALPVDPIHEVVRPSSITRVPHAPHPIRGVTNLRGRVVPVIDLRLRLELPEGDLTRGSRIVVVGSRGRRLGLLVDAVHQVVHLDLDKVQPPPDDVMTVQSDYISGVYHMDEELVLLLDVDRVLIIKEAPQSSAPTAGSEAA